MERGSPKKMSMTFSICLMIYHLNNFYNLLILCLTISEARNLSYTSCISTVTKPQSSRMEINWTWIHDEEHAKTWFDQKPNGKYNPQIAPRHQISSAWHKIKTEEEKTRSNRLKGEKNMYVCAYKCIRERCVFCTNGRGSTTSSKTCPPCYLTQQPVGGGKSQRCKLITTDADQKTHFTHKHHYKVWENPPFYYFSGSLTSLLGSALN